MNVVLAPSNLGLRPLRPGHVPGAWRAPEALLEAGLLDGLSAAKVVSLDMPQYSPAIQYGTDILNGPEMRRFGLELADAVERLLESHAFLLVVGGDCSILPAVMAGVRRRTESLLVHFDGHSDFRHPGNYAPEDRPVAAAGMDLAMVTGRGEKTATDWPGASSPLVPDERVVQVGERESRDEDFAWPDVAESGVQRIDIFEALEGGSGRTLAKIRDILDADTILPFWVHLDVDVLDQIVMPAVDTPGTPGFAADEFAAIVAPLLRDARCLGMNVTVFDPDLDPDGKHAETIVELLSGTLQ